MVPKRMPGVSLERTRYNIILECRSSVSVFVKCFPYRGKTADKRNGRKEGFICGTTVGSQLEKMQFAVVGRARWVTGAGHTAPTVRKPSNRNRGA